MSAAQFAAKPTPTAQRVFRAPEIWPILQALGAVAPGTAEPSEAGFDANTIAEARAALLRGGVLLADDALAPDTDALVRPTVAPQAVLLASVTERAAQDKPARMICFSRADDRIVVNWADSQGNHHFAAYALQDAGACALAHLSQVCDLDVKPPAANLPAPNPREVERAAEQMKQAVSLSGATDIGAPGQTAHAAGWFISGGAAWLMGTNPQGQALAPRRASQEDIAQAVLGLVDRLFARP